MNNIEQFKTEVDDIKKLLSELKSNVDISESEKKTRAEALKIQAESIKQKIQNEVNSLASKTDDESKKKKEEAETLLNSFNEIMNLYDSIIKEWNNTKTQQTPLPETESKWIFWNIKEWIWNQWSDVKSWDKWKSEPRKNTLRTLWFWLTWYAAYKWIKALWKKIFWKKEENDEENEEKESKKKKNNDEEEEEQEKSKKEKNNDGKKEEKKSFRDKWYWKITKWSLISSATWWGLYYLGKRFNLWWDKDNETKNKETQSTNEVQERSSETTQTQHQEKDESQNTTKQWKIDYSKVDNRWFTPWDYPFKHITQPFKWIKSYRVDNIKIKPLLWFADLARSWSEWEMTTLKVKDLTPKFSTKTAWYKKNNPCNVSPFKGDIWRTSSSKVADWQNHAQYSSMEDWLASFMKLMRTPTYRNKSIQWMNCSWMQWIYKANEPDSLKALRITWITHASEALKVDPLTRLNTDDKETMMAFAQQTAINESWSYFDRATLERAYKKAFG